MIVAHGAAVALRKKFEFLLYYVRNKPQAGKLFMKTIEEGVGRSHKHGLQWQATARNDGHGRDGSRAFTKYRRSYLQGTGQETGTAHTKVAPVWAPGASALAGGNTQIRMPSAEQGRTSGHQGRPPGGGAACARGGRSQVARS